MVRRRLVAIVTTVSACAAAFLSPARVSLSTQRSHPRLPNVLLDLRMHSTALSASSSNPCLQLATSSCMIPHPDKAAKGGEDACFVLENDMGVFDGVGGWALKGYDPGKFTRSFAEAVAANITAQRLEESTLHDQNLEQGISRQRVMKGVNLEQALEYATAQTPGKGTCTACLVTYDPRRELLSGVNVGDSGALLVRRDTRGTPFVALRSVTQRHGFNQPYQLGTPSRDKPRDALPFGFFVREGDVVVLATDGLLDNMYEADIVRCIAETCDIETESSSASADRMLQPRLDRLAADLAGALARRAFEHSSDKERVTPWEEEAVAARIILARDSFQEEKEGLGWAASPLGIALERGVLEGIKAFRGEGGQNKKRQNGRRQAMSEEDELIFRGGKVDDITVVVATVQRGRALGSVDSARVDRNSDLAATDGGRNL